MYAFVFGLNGKVIFGRDWIDFIDCLKALQEAYNLNEEKRLVCFIHNEAFEFQWRYKRLKWLEVFAVDERKPVRALCEYGIEFCDSYILSGLGLDKTAKNLTKYKIEKLSGALNYDLPRHSRTKLLPEEWHYIENDGLTLMAFIQEEIEQNGNNITRIPMTKTGYVRKHLKNECYHGGNAGHGARRKNKTRTYSQYRKLMLSLTLEVEEYKQQVECFQGGFTHANNFNSGLIFNDVSSCDLCSAYPTTMCLDPIYPMGKGTFVKSPTRDEIRKYIKLYACIFRMRLYGVKSRFRGDSFLSYSKCRNVKGKILDNGRILKADYLETTCTEIDLEIYRAFYTFEKIEIFDMWYYPRGYLPKAFIKGILGLYADKTTLKGVEGMEAEFLLKKGMLNSSYGMACMRVDQVLNTFEAGQWGKEEANLEEIIKQYNLSSNRFSFYGWSIFVTAAVRKTIAKSVLELGDDFIYADTDSVKFIHWEKHKDFFDRYNANIMRKIKRSADYNGLDVSLYMPKTKDGIVKPLGIFENEGNEEGISYKRFKTLGAKRYFVEYPESHNLGGIETPYSLTISGVNKTAAIPALVEKAKKEKRDIFDYFEVGFEFDKSMAGKMTHTYCDYEIRGKLTDYNGVTFPYHELTFLHLEKTTYKLTTTEEYYEQLYLDQKNRLVRREDIEL